MFIDAADFESKNTYDVEVEVDDPAVGTTPDDSVAFTLDVADVNEPPTIGGLDGDTSAVLVGGGFVRIDEGADATLSNPDSPDSDGGFLTVRQTSGIANGGFGFDGAVVTAGGDGGITAGETVAVGGTPVGTIDALEDGQAGNDLRIVLGGQATDARIQSLLRHLTYAAPTGPGYREFRLTLDDGDGVANGGDADAWVDVTTTVALPPPSVSNLDGDAVTFTEGSGPIPLDAGTDAVVTDSYRTNYNGGRAEVDVVGGRAAGDRLVVTTDGAVALPGGQVQGTAVEVSGVPIGTFAHAGGDGGLSVDLNVNASPARVSAFLNALRFDNVAGEDPVSGDRTVRINVTDDSTPDDLVDDADVTVTVAPVNDPPAVTIGGDQTVSADAPAQSIPNFATGFDPVEPSQSLEEYLATADDASLFATGPSIDASGTLSFTPASDADGTATVTVRARDDGGTANGGSDTSQPQTFAITVVGPANDDDGGGGGSAGDVVGTPSIDVADASLSATSVEPGGTVTVTVDVENVGDGDGTRAFSLAIDGETVDTKRVYLGAEGARTITLDHVIDEPGTYAVSVDGEPAGTVTVGPDGTTQAPPTETPVGAQAGAETTTPATTEGGAGPQPDDTPTDGTEGTGPGFGIGVAFVALLVAVGLRYRAR